MRQVKKTANRAKSKFKQKGYPSKRPWFPFAYDNVYQEVIPSIASQYP